MRHKTNIGRNHQRRLRGIGRMGTSTTVVETLHASLARRKAGPFDVLLGRARPPDPALALTATPYAP